MKRVGSQYARATGHTIFTWPKARATHICQVLVSMDVPAGAKRPGGHIPPDPPIATQSKLAMPTHS